jgi:hypothetical protein
MSFLNKTSFVTSLRIWKKKFFEFVRHDSKIASFLLSIIYILSIYILIFFKKNLYYILSTGKLFRHTNFEIFRNFSISILKQTIRKTGYENFSNEILSYSLYHINNQKLENLKESIIRCQDDIFHKRLLILSHPIYGHKGVIIIKFTDYFKYFIALFDTDRLSKDYVLIVEPSWAGYFDEDFLCLSASKMDIIVQSPEPVDYQFVKMLNHNLWPVEVGSNWWVDKRIFFPMPNVKKKYDIIMVSNWADVKRHYHLFECLSKSKNRTLKVALVGKPWPKSIFEIKNEALYYGVEKKIDFFENISQRQLNILYNKSRCHLLLSKKEGVNKAIIEAMYSDIPSYILEGFNYGHRYSYINSLTGGFISSLNYFLDNFNNYINGSQSPFEWVNSNLSPYRANMKFIEIFNTIEKNKNILINKNLALKVNIPEMQYTDSTYWDSYHHYYKNLSSFLK